MNSLLALLVSTSAAIPPLPQDPAPRSNPRPAAAAGEPKAPLQDAVQFVAAPKPLAKGAIVEDWPGFLGPRRDGTSMERPLLKSWPEGGPKLVWSVERGEGYASPAIQGNRLVYSHRERESMVVDCRVADTGKLIWRHEYPCDYDGMYISNNGARSTPQIDGDRVFIHGVEGILHCLELATGDVVWARDLKKDYKLEEMFFGVVCSPLIVGDLLITNLGAPGGPTVAAFNKADGELVWGAGETWGMSCASPVLATIHGNPRVLVLAGGKSRPPTGGLMVIDPSDGSLVEKYPFRSRVFESVNGANPVPFGNRVLLTSSYGTGSSAIQLLPEGGAELAWSNRRVGIEFSAPIIDGNYCYAVQGAHDRIGAIVCLDLDDGTVVDRTDFDWEETVPYQGRETEITSSIGVGSMIRADDAYLCLGDNGHLLWLNCTPTGTQVLQRASLFRANESWTPPVISRGLLYVCQNKRERFGSARRRLLCFDLRGGS